MNAILDQVLTFTAFAVAIGAAPFFWVMSHRHELSDDVRYAGATISVAAFHLGTSCLITRGSSLLLLSTVVHLIIAAVLLVRALARAEAKRLLTTAVRVLFMKSVPSKRIS